MADQPTLAASPGIGPPPPAPSGAHPPPVPPSPPAPYGPPYGAGPHGYGYGGYGYAPTAPQQPGYPAYGGYPGPAPGGHPGFAHPGFAHPGVGWVAPLPNGQSVAAMVLGIVSMVLIATCYGIVLAVITSPIALGLGIAARRKVARGELGGQSQATAGFVMGIIGVVISALALIVLVIAIVAYEDSDHDDSGHATATDAPAVTR